MVMFENMPTPGGGTITLVFKDEPTEEYFRKQFKTEEQFMNNLPDDILGSSEDKIFEIIESATITTTGLIPMVKFSGPTKEQFERFIADIDAVKKVEENKDEDCRICINPFCLGRKKSFDEEIYKKAVKEFTKDK